MAEKKIQLRIITPTALKLDEPADMVILRCISGDWGVMPNHETYSAVLDHGMLRIRDGDNERAIVVLGGFAQIKDNVLTILTSMAEWPEEIDRARAEAERERAEKIRMEATDDVDLLNAQYLLRRSLVMIEASSYVYTNNPDYDG